MELVVLPFKAVGNINKSSSSKSSSNYNDSFRSIK